MAKLKELVELREKRRWTQEKLSLKSGVSRSTIANIETGGETMLETALKIGDALGVKDTKTLRRIFLPWTVAQTDNSNQTNN